MIKKVNTCLVSMLLFCIVALPTTVKGEKAAATSGKVELAAQGPTAGGFNPSRKNQLIGMMKRVGRYALLYIPNRLIDASDIITLNAGFGGAFASEIQVTRYFQFGGSHGATYFLGKDYFRQFGGGYHNSTRFGMFCFETDVTFVDETFGTTREYVIDYPQFSVAEHRLDAFRDNDVDFWAIGGNFGWLINIGVGIHPVEIFDFVVNIFCYDVLGDDLK